MAVARRQREQHGDPRQWEAAATVVLAEDLAEEAPDGGDGSEHSVAILDAVLIESVEDAEFAQGVGERQSLVARKRARTSSRVVMGISDVLSGSDANPGSATGVQSGERSLDQESPPTCIIAGRV